MAGVTDLLKEITKKTEREKTAEMTQRAAPSRGASASLAALTFTFTELDAQIQDYQAGAMDALRHC